MCRWAWIAWAVAFMLQLFVEVGVERAEQVGRVLLVVAHERRDRVLVEAPHLLRDGWPARGRAGGRCRSPISSPGGPPPAAVTPSTSSASSSARRGSAAALR